MKIKIDPTKVICRNILGLGVQWDTQDGGIPPLTPAQWELTYKRLDFMKVKFARVMTGSVLERNGGTNLHSRLTDNLYKILDYCESRGVTVMLGEWNKPGFIQTHDDAAWLNSIADLLLHLRDEKKYTCIKFYNFINEPNGDWMIKSDNWNKWYKGITALHKIFTKRGIQTPLCGPDSAYADNWVHKCITDLPEVISDYEYHIYVDNHAEIFNNSIEERVNAMRQYVNTHAPNGADKLLWLGELGCKDGVDFALDCQPRVADYIYGLWMGYAVMQVFRGGLHGVIPWCLDDAMHIGAGDSHKFGGLKRWGFWNSMGGQTVQGSESATYYPPEDADLRPWFYPMALFSRVCAQGADVVFSECGNSDIKTLACLKDGAVSLAILNPTDEDVNVSIEKIPENSGLEMCMYVYSEGGCPVDAEGFPVAKEIFDLNSAEDILIPSRGIVFVTP